MKQKSFFSPIIRGTILMQCILSMAALHATEEKLSIKASKLCFERANSNTRGKEIFLNGRKIGEVPVSTDKGFQNVSIEIPLEALPSVATINIVNIENKPSDPKKSAGKDLFTVKNIFMEVTDSSAGRTISDIVSGPLNSFKTGFVDTEKGKREYTYSGAPLSEIRLTLPTGRLGYMKQPFFENKTGLLYRDDGRKKWHGLDEVCLPDTSRRTMCNLRVHELVSYPKEYLLEMMDRHNASILLLSYSDAMLKSQKDKIAFLRQHGIKIGIMYSGIPASSRVPESAEYKEFFLKLAEWSKLTDMAGMDEWFLSPPVLKTDGGKATEITEKFLAAFGKYSGYSSEDAKWAFKNHTSDDPRALKAWEFCDKVQNDFAREFVRVAKSSNPQITTWVSHVTKNWNKSVTCVDSAINDFDEILDCQTYWYGRFAKDSLNSPVLTAPLGRGKIFKAEYPGKFLWMGIDPGFVGEKGEEARENSWGRQTYNNTPEEVVPYLALLYAVSDGVFVESSGGGVWLKRDKPSTDGNFYDKFADVTALVSKIVPYVKSYKKSDIAYYYDPDADWEIMRKVYSFTGPRETNEVAIGLLQQFCDLDVTKDTGKYKNVVYAGMLLPAKFDYAGQNIYLMFAPGYDEKGNKIPEEQLAGKLDIKGFEPLGKNFFPSDGFNENGSRDLLKISGLLKETLSSGKIIRGAAYPTRKASYSDSNDYFLIGAHNKKGNVLLNSLWPSFIQQDVSKKLIMKDLDYFGWTKRNCPQVDGTDKIVAVAFRDPRTAVLDFGSEASFATVRIIIFNGSDGVVRNETISYARGMKIELPPLNVLVAQGIEDKKKN